MDLLDALDDVCDRCRHTLDDAGGCPNCGWRRVRPIESAAGRSVSAMMQKAPHFQAAYDLGGDIAEADRWNQPRPFPKVPSAEELWERIMGDESRADWPANTLPQLRAELEAGYRDFW